MKIIASHPNYELLYLAEEEIVLMKFKGDIAEDVYKDFWTKSIDFGVENKIKRVIIDQQEIGNVSFLARAWVVVNAFPRVKKELPKDLAATIISSGRLVQKSGMQYLLKAFVGLTGYNVEIHPTPETAVEFLKTANKRNPVVA